MKSSQPAIHDAATFYSNYKWHLFIGIFIASFLLYVNTLNHSLLLDDKIAIANNSHVQDGFDGIPALLGNSYMHGFNGSNENTYRPVSLISFAVENQLFGGDPFYFHLFNVLSYALLCALLARFLFQIFPKQNYLVLIAMIALFAAHPIHTEVVANVKSRDEIYAMLFGVLSLSLFLKFDQVRKKSLLFWSLVFYLLSLLSKESSVTLLAIFPMTLYFFRGYDIKGALKKSALFALPVLVMLLLRVMVLDDIVLSNNDSKTWKIAFHNTLFAAQNYLEELATNCAIFFRYIEQVVLPTSFSYDYSIGTFDVVTFSNIQAIAGAVILIALIAISIWKFRSKSVVSFAILFFLLTFSITSNFIIKIGSTMGERFLFLPSLGIVILIVVLLHRVLLKFKVHPLVFSLLVMVMVSFYSFKTVDRNKDWKNMLILAQKDIQTNPKSGLIQVSLGQEYKAVMETEKDSLRIKKAAALSLEYFKKSLQYHPNTTDINYSMGDIYLDLQDYTTALEFFDKSLPVINAVEHIVYYKKGLCYENLGKDDLAIQTYRKAIDLNPNVAGYWRNLGYVYSNNSSKVNETLEAFTKSNDLRGGKSTMDLINIAIIHHQSGNAVLAREYYLKVLEIDSNNKPAKRNLGILNRR